mmetsp:Transcript_32269/g.97519  ORF Transcript_32269/g.97519 Transcript_32269/m.97519 type:complete len:286 (-) Transcript_32269:70-927(-)
MRQAAHAPARRTPCQEPQSGPALISRRSPARGGRSRTGGRSARASRTKSPRACCTPAPRFSIPCGSGRGTTCARRLPTRCCRRDAASARGGPSALPSTRPLPTPAQPAARARCNRRRSQANTSCATPARRCGRSAPTTARENTSLLGWRGPWRTSTGSVGAARPRLSASRGAWPMRSTALADTGRWGCRCRRIRRRASGADTPRIQRRSPAPRTTPCRSRAGARGAGQAAALRARPPLQRARTSGGPSPASPPSRAHAPASGSSGRWASARRSTSFGPRRAPPAP